MFNLKTASLEVRKAAKAMGIGSGQWEPVNSNRTIDSLPDDAVIAVIYNRNHKNGIEITAGDVRYAGLYL